MPNRVIKDSIKSSAQIDSLTWFEEVVFYRLMVSADDYGCYDGRPIYLKNALFPTKDNVTRKAIEDAIQRLVSAGLLIKYEVNGMPYLFFPTWEKHQRIRNKKRKYPAPPDDILLTANCGQMTATCHPESESELESESKPKEKGGQAAKRFTPPTVEDVEAYIRERKSNVNARRFVDFYASKGWMVGKNPMKDWRAAIRTWEQRDGAQLQEVASSAPDAGELERMRKLRERLKGDS